MTTRNAAVRGGGIVLKYNVNMKRLNRILHNWPAAAFILLTASLAACTADPIEMEVGSGAAYDPVGKVKPGFYSPQAISDTMVRVWVKPGEKFEDVLTFGLTKEAPEDVTVTFSLVNDESKLFAYSNLYSLQDFQINDQITGEMTLLKRMFAYVPLDKLEMPSGDQVVRAGTYGLEFPVSIDLKDGEEGRCSHLVELHATIPGIDGAEPEEYVFYYELLIDPMAVRTPPTLLPGHATSKLDYVVAYLNPSWLDPRACLEVALESDYMQNVDPYDFIIKYYELIDGVTLIGGSVGYDAESKMPELKLDGNLFHVLRGADKYLKPLQDAGMEVMMEITGGGMGVGFCNLDDAQRASLVEQVRKTVVRYGLDGVNLDDEMSGYGREGMPAIDPASYAKFIRDLRTALGKDKLITLTDIGEPSATLYQTRDGIEAGTYLDYAWTGEGWTFADPYKEGKGTIAGLSREKYGRFTARYRDTSYSNEEQMKFMDELVEISQTDDPRIVVGELMPIVEGAESQTGPNLFSNLLNVCPVTDLPEYMELYMMNPGSALEGFNRNPGGQTGLPQYGNMIYYPDWLRF